MFDNHFVKITFGKMQHLVNIWYLVDYEVWLTMTIGRKFVESQPRGYFVYVCCVGSCARISFIVVQFTVWILIAPISFHAGSSSS